MHLCYDLKDPGGALTRALSAGTLGQRAPAQGATRGCRLPVITSPGTPWSQGPAEVSGRRYECRNKTALRATQSEVLPQGLSRHALVFAGQNAHHRRLAAACNNAALLRSLYHVYRQKLGLKHLEIARGRFQPRWCYQPTGESTSQETVPHRWRQEYRFWRPSTSPARPYSGPAWQIRSTLLALHVASMHSAHMCL